MKSTFYMVGNAHLDPVWQWRWQEGSAEAKATIRSALDRMNETPEFVFVCSSVSIYQWIEAFDPDMFEEIKKRVEEGRFIVIGGWFVQPDCNLPSGEGFAHQSLYNQRWFYEKFGKVSKIGYNVDSFGHNGMLPQILKKSGMEAYIFMRPHPEESSLPYNLFSWISPDGSSVPTYRIPLAYCCNFDDVEKFNERLERASDFIPEDIDFAFRFYGVGNHGGGPTKKNLEVIKEYQKNHPEKKIIFSNILDLFEKIKDEKIVLPEWKSDLQHHAPGCYSAHSGIKKAIRISETELVSAEKFSVLGSVLANRKYPAEKLRDAWQNINFLHFHDIAGGCAIREAYKDAELFAGEARMIAAREINNALQTISWRINTSDYSKGIPVVVFNPHPWEYNGIIQINSQAYRVTDRDGKVIKYQSVRSSKHSCYRMDDTIFNVSLPPMGYNVYYISADKPWTESNRQPLSDESVINVSARFIHKENLYHGFFENAVLENEFLYVEFDEHTGHIISIYDKQKEREYLSASGAVPAVMNYTADTWGHGVESCHDLIGVFSEPKITVLENGPIRATVLVESRYNHSKIKQYFSLIEGEKKLRVNVVLDWHEKHRMLKIQFPVAVTNPKSYYEIPFGVIERPCNAIEEPGQRWIAISGEEGRLALINDCKYSFSFAGNVMEMTVLHSSIYCDHGGHRDSESEYTEQGEQRFSYEVMPVEKAGWSSVIRAANELNNEPVNIIENNHYGPLGEYYEGLQCDKNNVIVSTVKRAENGTGIVIRAYETDGLDTSVTIWGNLLKTPLNTNFKPYEIKTFLLDDSTLKWREVLMTEFEVID